MIWAHLGQCKDNDKEEPQCADSSSKVFCRQPMEEQQIYAAGMGRRLVIGCYRMACVGSREHMLWTLMSHNIHSLTQEATDIYFSKVGLWALGVLCPYDLSLSFLVMCQLHWGQMALEGNTISDRQVGRGRISPMPQATVACGRPFTDLPVLWICWPISTVFDCIIGCLTNTHEAYSHWLLEKPVVQYGGHLTVIHRSLDLHKNSVVVISAGEAVGKADGCIVWSPARYPQKPRFTQEFYCSCICLRSR